VGNYRQLLVWKRAHHLALAVYRCSGGFPGSERYGLTTQVRRASVSVVSNVVEGCARHGNREQVRFLRIAHGSICELQCQLLLSRDLEFLDPASWKQLDDECQQIGKMLNGLMRSLRSHSPSRLQLTSDD
jgi:four helix bundle protein